MRRQALPPDTGGDMADVAERVHISQRGDEEMADKGKKDKARREQQKKAQHTLKEKRKLKQEKKRKMPNSDVGIA